MLTTIAIACTMATCAWEIDTWGEVASQLPPCPTEDSNDCFFDAGASGRSFIAISTEAGARVLYEPVGNTMHIVEEIQ